ncbi:MAG: GFA family protein [Rhodanobacteraceae bacterium]
MTGPSHEGGCLCGATRYRTSADPRALTLCHCNSCRRASGAPSVAWAVFSAETFEFTKDEPARFRSSPNVERTFCARCGTPLTYQSDSRRDAIDVTTATLDEPDRFAPTFEIWVGEKIAWETLDDKLPHYPRSSKDSAPA